MVLGMVKLKHRRSTPSPIMRGRDVSKMGFKGIHNRFQKDLRYRDAQLKAHRTEAKCIEMDELAQKDFTFRPSLRSLRDIRKPGLSL